MASKPRKQYVPKKPNGWGFKDFKDVFLLNFEEPAQPLAHETVHFIRTCICRSIRGRHSGFIIQHHVVLPTSTMLVDKYSDVRHYSF